MAANKERGEIPLKVGDTTYVLKLTSNACCAMETASGRTFSQLLAGVANECLSDIRLMLWAMLQAHHPTLTLLDVGDLIDEAGGVLEVDKQLGLVVRVNTEEGKAAPKGRNPRKARARGTGGNST